MTRRIFYGIAVSYFVCLCANLSAQIVFFDDFENGVSRNTTGVGVGFTGTGTLLNNGVWAGYDNGFFGYPQWLESSDSKNHTPGGTRSGRAFEADPWVYNSYADFGPTDGALTATVYLWDDFTYVYPYTEPHEAQRASHIEIRSMFTLFGDTPSHLPDETDPNSDYLHIRLIPDLRRPEDPLPVEPGQQTDFYTYGIQTKYNDDNDLGIIDTGVPRKNGGVDGWLKMTIEADAVADGGEVRFFLDDVPVGTSQRSGADLRFVMLGATGPTYQNFWYDDVSVETDSLPAEFGDFNADRYTNAADYAVWRKLNDTDPAQYATWQEYFGFKIHNSAGVPGAGGSSAPEPSTLISLCVCGIALSISSRARRRQ